MAVSAAVMASGMVVLFVAIILSTRPLALIAVGFLFLAVATTTIWLLLMVGRARLPGNSLLVPHESLPGLQARWTRYAVGWITVAASTSMSPMPRTNRLFWRRFRVPASWFSNPVP